ncbi:nuclear transport factor 2 family protein [Mangrovibacterium lignilyticum]|uniref:nuclear transport factor 2 family protein n=1 Tax=Mangrovibacterium lignilyticum TaxID=2668052 RepID=UPI0013D3933D|nr:nuclear transport factor 2 family protein [Mangrovibacterium lignilyticum]
MKNLELLKKGYQAFGEGNIAAVLETWHDDIVWEECSGMPMVEGDGKYVGANNVVGKVLARLLEYIDNFSLEISHFIDGGDQIAMVGYYKGTLKSTGNTFRAQATHAWKFKDGKASHFFQAVDTATILKP